MIVTIHYTDKDGNDKTSREQIMWLTSVERVIRTFEEVYPDSPMLKVEITFEDWDRKNEKDTSFHTERDGRNPHFR